MKSWGVGLAVVVMATGSAMAQTTTPGAPALSISNNSPLPAAAVGVAYAQTLTPSGGTSPYRWILGGTPPPGLTLGTSSGVLAGTPTAPGIFNVTVQVTDNVGVGATKTLSLTVNAPPLTITTEALFNATVGIAYAQTFAASGGIPPYQWRITSGQTGGLVFDSPAASLTGTPQAAGSATFSLQVTDSAGTTAAKTFTLVVDAPRLTILNGSQLPAGINGQGYSQKFSGVGGTPPYSWTITSGIPGLQLDSTTGIVSGTPSTSGAFMFAVQLRDSAGLTATKSFTVVISPSALLFTSQTQLTPGQLGVAYTETIGVSGGVPPYTWSATGLPEGLDLDVATGQISGIAKAPGTFTFAVRVTDNARSSATDLFRLAVNLPALPQIQLTGLDPSVDAAAQPRLEFSLSSPYLTDLSGQLTLSFAPDSGPGDPSIQFSTGGRVVAFRIPAGETRPLLPAELALQTGTVAGTLRIAVQLRVADAVITPDPPPAFSARVERSAPRIKTAQLMRSGSGFSIQVTGFSTSREVTQATFRFRAAPGNEVRTREIQVPLEDLFGRWYQDSASSPYGSQFSFNQPFTMLQGDASNLLLESVTLFNRAGSTTLTLAQ